MAPTEDTYSCKKLAAVADIVHSRHRLRTPLIRNKARVDADWKEIPWDRALQEISTNLKYFKRQYGAQSICWIRGNSPDWGATWDYTQRLMNAFGSPNAIGMGHVCYEARALAHFYTYGAMTSPDYENAKCIVSWGKNDADTNPAGYEGILKSKRRGGKLIVIDPIRTELAEMADIWLQIKPGSDGLLAMTMINVIISEGLFEGRFIREWTVGFRELKKASENYPPETFAEKMWLDAEKIRESARLYAQTKPSCLVDGNGLDMHVNVFQNMRSICILRALSGNLDKNGGDLIPQPIPVRDIRLKEHCPSNLQPVTHQYPLMNNCHKISGYHALSALVDAIIDERPYPIKALIVQGANPAVTMANSKKFLWALNKLEFIVVIDLFKTRTAEHADIILPAASSFEKTQLNARFMRSNRVAIQNQVIDSVGESWPDWKIMFELAKRIDCQEEFPWKTVEEAIDYQLEPAGINTEMLRKNPDGIIFRPIEYEKYTRDGFATSTGKIEFYSDILAEAGYLPLPMFEVEDLNLFSFYENRSDYPLIGITGARPNSFVHSQFRNIPSLRKLDPEPSVDINPIDAKKIGIANGDYVQIETPNGQIKMKSKLSNIVYPGSLRLAWGWGEYGENYNVNNLTDDKNRNPITSTTPNRHFMCMLSK